MPACTEQTGNAAYEEAIRLIRKMGALMRAQSLSHEFRNYVVQLRTLFKPKRNFIKLLDALP